MALDRIDRLAMKAFGKYWGDLDDGERRELKKHPLFYVTAYSMNEEDVQRLNTSLRKRE